MKHECGQILEYYEMLKFEVNPSEFKTVVFKGGFWRLSDYEKEYVVGSFIDLILHCPWCGYELETSDDKS